MILKKYIRYLLHYDPYYGYARTHMSELNLMLMSTSNHLLINV